MWSELHGAARSIASHSSLLCCICWRRSPAGACVLSILSSPEEFAMHDEIVNYRVKPGDTVQAPHGFGYAAFAWLSEATFKSARYALLRLVDDHVPLPMHIKELGDGGLVFDYVPYEALPEEEQLEIDRLLAEAAGDAML